jgi:hypothetical protein
MTAEILPLFPFRSIFITRDTISREQYVILEYGAKYIYQEKLLQHSINRFCAIIIVIFSLDNLSDKLSSKSPFDKNSDDKNSTFIYIWAKMDFYTMLKTVW